MTKHILTLLLALSLLLGCVPVQAAVLSTEEQYQAALDELRSYVTGDREVSLQDVFNQFSSLSFYRHSAMLAVYTRILLDIENEDFSMINQWIGYLRMNPDFCAFVSAEEEPLGSVDELEWYAKARQAESSGNVQQAVAFYQNCPSFMDSMLRLMGMNNEELEKKYQEAIRYYNMNTPEGYQKAYELFLELDGYKDSNNYLTMADLFRATPKPEVPSQTPLPPTPVPEPAATEPPTATGDFTLNGVCHKYSVQLSWTAVSGAASYRVYHAVTRNGQRDFKAVTDTQKTTITHTETSRGVNNYYYVEALDQNGSVLKTSGEAKVYVTPNPTPTPKPTWSAWSSWSATNPGAATSTRQVEKKTQYRYRTSSTSQQWGSWGSWSSWSETAVSKTDSRDVETKQETKTTTTYKYKYTRWKYFNTSENAWWESYCEYTGSSYKPGSGYWQSKTTDTPLNRIETVDGRPVYEGYWYNETKEPVNTSTTVTLYRYRTRSLENVTTWSGWSSWQDASVASSSTCQVETRTVYRYRTLK